MVLVYLWDSPATVPKTAGKGTAKKPYWDVETSAYEASSPAILNANAEPNPNPNWQAQKPVIDHYRRKGMDLTVVNVGGALRGSRDCKPNLDPDYSANVEAGETLGKD